MKRINRLATGIFISGSLCLLSHGIELRSYDPARHDRFLNFPSNLAPNPTFFLGDEDWSGFGWSERDTRKHFTLISPKHFVGASHFRPSVGDEIQFVNRAGVLKVFTVAARENIENDETPSGSSDLFIGELVETVEEEDLITIVPVYNLATEAEYTNEEIVMSGQHSRAGLNVITSVGDYGGEPGSPIARTRGVMSTYTDPGFGNDRCYLVPGDSGGPSAVRTGSGFALVGTHSSVLEATILFTTTYTHNDAFVPHYMDRLDAVMEEEGYHVTRFNTTTPDLTFSLTESEDPAISSEGVSYTLTVANSMIGEVAHNLKLELSCDAEASFASVSGPDWVVSNDGSTLQAVRGGLDPDETVVVEVNVNLPDEPEGEVTFSATLSADGHSDLSLVEPTEVVQSFESWAVGLSESGPAYDPDRDGTSNFLEFALGRDGGVAETGMELSVGEGEFGGTFTRRIHQDLLGLELSLERSVDLENWTRVMESELLATPSDSQLETVAFSESLAERAFFRFRVPLPTVVVPD